jgi:hypothetical protein
MACIFGSPLQLAMLKVHMPRHFHRIANYQAECGTTIKRGANIEQFAAKGTVPELEPH